MSTRVTVLFIAMAMFIIGGTSFADEDHAHGEKKGANEEKSITGEVVDLSCFIDHDARGAKHKKCARTCAAKGLPMGIVTEAGDLYLFIEDHGKAKHYKSAINHAAEVITVTGTVSSKNGIRAIKVSDMVAAKAKGKAKGKAKAKAKEKHDHGAHTH